MGGDRLSAFHTKLGVIVGLISIPFLFVPVLDLLMGHCFFEQGCGEHENLKLLGAFVATCFAAVCVGWLVSRLARFVQETRDKT